MTTTTAIGYVKNLPATHPDALITREIEVPALGPHDLLVEVNAVSVNPVDVKERAGAPADGFRVLGFDAAGTVRDVGSAVTLFAVGDEVFYAGSIDRPGANQRLHVVDERITGRRPRTLSFADAAALPLTAITAWETLFDRLSLTEDSTGTLLVVGATGGVGSVMLELAEALLPNVTVIATASDDERAAWVRELGAEHVVNHRDDLARQVLAVTPEGVNWVFTSHSEGQITTYAQLVRPFGHITAIDDGPRDVSPLKGKCIAWHWELMFTRPLQQTPDLIEQHRLLNAVSELVEQGRIRTTATRVLAPISAATLREAHELLERTHHRQGRHPQLGAAEAPPTHSPVIVRACARFQSIGDTRLRAAVLLVLVRKGLSWDDARAEEVDTPAGREVGRPAGSSGGLVRADRPPPLPSLRPKG